MRRSRGGKTSKIQRLLDFQSGLCKSCGLPPSRLMLERREIKKIKVGFLRKKKMRGQLEAGGEAGKDIMLSSTPTEVRKPTLPTQPQTMLASSEIDQMMQQWSGEGKEGLHIELTNLPNFKCPRGPLREYCNFATKYTFSEVKAMTKNRYF